MRKLEILDCTLRDGSYVVDFQLSKKTVAFVTKGLVEAGIPRIEVGHGVGFDAYRSQYNSAKHSEKEYIKTANYFKGKSKIGHFFIPNIGKLENIPKSVDWGLDFIRVGINISEVEKAKDAVRIAKDSGLEVSINLMKSYALDPEKFKEKALIADSFEPDIIAIVDSAGGMFQEDIQTYIRSIRDDINADIGFHGHNNLMLAIANSLTAIDEGAQVVDCSLLGMGRGGGNAQTEVLGTIMEKKKLGSGLDIYRLMDLGETYIKPLLENLQGILFLDVTAGYAQFHSSFLNRFKPVAKEFNIDIRDLIIKVSEIEKVSPTNELIREVAEQIVTEKNTKNIKYPRKFFIDE